MTISNSSISGYIRNNKVQFGLGLAVMCILIAMPIFGLLDLAPVQEWDEARLAINATEMKEHGNLIVTYFDGAPDMWNTKPPLMIWLLAASISLFGLNEIAVRLPSAVAAMLSCMLLYWFLAKKLNSIASGIISVLILVTSYGYITIHGSRTGDYDALLTFFTTGYILALFLYLETDKQKFLSWFFAGFIGAVLTKGIAGFMFVPALFIYTMVTRNTLKLLTSRIFWLGCFTIVIFVGGYYFIREVYNPGYLKAVSENELGGRFLHTVENHKMDNWYYVNLLISTHFKWYLLAVCGTISGLCSKVTFVKRLALILTLCTTTYILLISVAATKLAWYLMPAYPLMALLCAILVWQFIQLFIVERHWNSVWQINLTPSLLIFLIFPYRETLSLIEEPIKEANKGEIWYVADYLKDLLHNNNTATSVLLLTNTRPQNVKWYIKALEGKHIAVSFLSNDSICAGMDVTVFENAEKRFVQQHFKFDSTQQNYSVMRYHIIRRKLNPDSSLLNITSLNNFQTRY